MAANFTNRPEIQITRDRLWFAGAEQEGDESDAEAFEDHQAEEDRLQDLDDADPSAPMKPAFPDGAADQSDERANEERGNRGPDEEPGFGQGA